MPDTIIENPILNSPFLRARPPLQVHREGITNEIVGAAGPARTSSRSPGPRRRASSSRSTPSGRRTGSRRTKPSTASASGSASGGKEDTSASPPPRAATAATGPTPTASASCSSARSRPWRRSFIITEVAKKFGDAWIENDVRAANDTSNPGLPRHRAQDGDGLGQDGRHGHAHRLAGAEQAGKPAGRPVHRHLPDRQPRHHHPRPPARPAAQRPEQLLPAARHRPGRSDRTAGPGARSSSPTSTPSSSARRSRPAS